MGVKPKKAPWGKRHPVWATLIMVIVIIGVISSLTSKHNKPAPHASPADVAASQEATATPTPTTATTSATTSAAPTLTAAPTPETAAVSQLAAQDQDPTTTDAQYRVMIEQYYSCRGSGDYPKIAADVDRAARTLDETRSEVLTELDLAMIGTTDCTGMLSNYIATTQSGGTWPPAAPASQIAPTPASSNASVGCTTTSRGTCIQGGEFCPVADEGTDGTDAAGDTYICTDSSGNGHPHWETP